MGGPGSAAFGHPVHFDRLLAAGLVLGSLGATIGTLSGIQVMHFNDRHPDNKLARWLTHVSVAPNGTRGVGVGMSLPLR